MLITLAAMALAQPATPVHPCEKFGELAESIMYGRQANVPMSKILIAIAPTLEAYPDGWDAMLKDAVRDAYKRPNYYTPEAKAEEVMRFRSDWEAVCFDSYEA